jgi:2-polyprenyl-6-methoxyphenol hydroxylase-like FAD-dependent oxidoreductase
MDKMIDVLIIGAGPTGLTLAAELQRRGVAHAIVDKAQAGANTSRAAVVHARTLEVLEPLGITEELLRQGVKVPIFRVRDRDRPLVTIPFKHIPSDYPFTLMCPQDRTEAILGRRLQALGGEVARGLELVEIEAAPDGVEASLKSPDSKRIVRARYLVGCDGMHSRVRQGSGAAFEGAQYEQGFVLADVKLGWPIGREEVSLFFSPKGLVVVAPLPEDHFRIVATMDDAPEHPSADLVQLLLDERGPEKAPGRVLDCVWSGRFRVHHRLAKSFRRGRLLLCGDAAHVHSPAGGQGMNTGIQDAVALSEALQQDDETVLDAWANDRRKVAQKVVALTDRLTRAATLESPLGRGLRNAAFSLVGGLPPVREAIARTLAELDAR